ncbi:hypothetical protein C3747_329g15 [Trypanosoma cruzi]|nr:hypothetical protein C3747_329g15 [Trypanosoma cruzi]RNC44333.1 geranylgeranyltransferase type I beta subunit [Trypanosoma cruzi]
MPHAVVVMGEDDTSQILGDDFVHLQYFSDPQRCMPAKVQQQQHSQRIILLYFSLLGRDLLGVDWRKDDGVFNAERDKLFEEMRRCYDTETGGFCPVPVSHYNTSATLSMTHCALQILNLCDFLPKATEEWAYKEKVMSFVMSCHIRHERPLFGESFRGAFQAAPGIAEVDIRFTYSALVSMALLCKPQPLSTVSSLQSTLQEAVAFIWRCWDAHEGAFGAVPGAEAHGGMTFCAVASLALAGAMSSLTRSHHHLLLRYCTARLSGGPDDHESIGSTGVIIPIVGYQGRPQKECDTCYSHWIGSTLRILQTQEHDFVFPVDVLPIFRFMGNCVDSEHGGIRKDFDMRADIVHASLGLSGLLLHVDSHCVSKLRPPHPVYGCSWSTVRNTGLPELVVTSTSTL